MFTYTEDGGRTPFDPTRLHFAGCLLCGGRAAHAGIFIPTTDAMRAVVIKLRRHAQPPRSTSGVAYGLCWDCADRDDVFARVEHALEAAAAEIVVQ